ncbi:MAG: RagB/SusD family nutrient uptake outer membrane protein [Candidatus Pedobacter colombiensis]|uniref:RagB/SusD family nutrient uptake outer membrane protein n=1 Tax=Candidatus Pedobacter colombiensis TaxID=3121371 RepID=A0AAJ5W5R0_9SPHI|nr:RagB/SusD family nutrient uptake outer membrane protein [Pedobacter sp.]WEK17635.1 MAG: RagB/SusD family nutrient uptake outer membrane protein [Pedobacter sp.]
MKKIKIGFIITLTSLLCSCQKYLDVVPDNVPTLDYAFHLRASAERYLFTCYSYMPSNGDINKNPGFNGADEVWYMSPIKGVNGDVWSIAQGLQSSSSPLANYWSGEKQGNKLFQAIRDCNIFLENIDKVADIEAYEKDRWVAEVTFLKAYYHFYLFRMYGPIPIVKQNLPLGSSPAEVQVYRQPVNEVVNYIVELLDEVDRNESLPDRLSGTENIELGRITRVIVKALKAKVLVTAASPLFNGGNSFFNLQDNKGLQLFNLSPDPQKWVKALNACKEAIDFSEKLGYKLYEFPPSFAYKVNDTIQTQMNIRAALSDKEANTEVIWPNTNSTTGTLQRSSIPKLLPGDPGSTGLRPMGTVAPTLKMAEMFYTNKGLPIEYDKAWQNLDRFALRTAVAKDRFYVKKGQETVQLHFDREPRFYADMGFDRGIWYGNAANNYDVALEDNGQGSLIYVQGRAGEVAAKQENQNYSITGYTVKKWVHIGTTQTPQMPSSNIKSYPWPELRLADLYLLYAEALNEVNGYNGGATTLWVNKIRARAGIPSVEVSWNQYSTLPGYYTDKNNLRSIIHKERAIELAFEGSRFWDLRRWLEAHQSGALNGPVKGWDITQKESIAYYREVLLFNQRYSMREYLWPLKISEMQINHNLVQNPGW